MRQGMFKRFELRAATCAAILCFAATALNAQMQQWKTYSYSTEGFSASFPSEPEAQKRNVDTQAGPFELRSYIVQNEAAALFVGICDYGEKVAGADPDLQLQNAKDGALQNSNSHLISEGKLTLGIYHGLRFESESDSAYFSARIYMIGTSLYQTLVVTPKGKRYPDETRFLDSFQLIPRTGN